MVASFQRGLFKGELMKTIFYIGIAGILAYLAYQHLIIGGQEREANIKYLDARQAIVFDSNYKKGVPLLQELVDMNYGLAVYDLGVIYEKGLGVQKDMIIALGLYKKAIPLLKQLSQSGDTMATGYIGEMYLYGRGVNKNRKKAKSIFHSIDDPKFNAYKNTMLKK